MERGLGQVLAAAAYWDPSESKIKISPVANQSSMRFNPVLARESVLAQLDLPTVTSGISENCQLAAVNFENILRTLSRLIGDVPHRICAQK